MIEGTWIILVGDEPYNPAKNQRVVFAADGTATFGKASGRYEVTDRVTRFDYTSDGGDGKTWHGAILARVDSDRSATMDGSIYSSPTAIPADVEKPADDEDDFDTGMICDPCLLIREGTDYGPVN